MAIKIQGTTVIDDSRNATNLSDITATGNVNFTGSGSVKVPSGTTAERPSSPSVGELRFNTDNSDFEQYDGSAWGPLSDVSKDDIIVDQEKYTQIIAQIDANTAFNGLNRSEFDEVFFDSFADDNKVDTQNNTQVFSISNRGDGTVSLLGEQDEDVVYFAGQDGDLYILDLYGNEKSKISFGNEINSTTLDKEGYFYVAGVSPPGSDSPKDAIVKINQNGDTIFAYGPETTAAIADDSRIVVDDNFDIIFSGRSSDPNVYKMDQEGNMVWTYSEKPSEDSTNGLAVDSNNDIYAIGDDEIHKINSSGIKVWSRTKPDSDEEVVSISISTDETYVVIGDSGGGVYKLNASNGNTVWSSSVSSYRIGGIAIDKNDFVYFSNFDGDIYKISSDGQTTVYSEKIVLEERAYDIAVDPDGIRGYVVYGGQFSAGLYVFDAIEGRAGDESTGEIVGTNNSDANFVNYGFLSSGRKFKSSGSFDSIDYDVGFVPSKIILTSELTDELENYNTNPSIQYIVSDGDNNTVTLSQSDIGDEIDVSNFTSSTVKLTVNMTAGSDIGNKKGHLYAVFDGNELVSLDTDSRGFLGIIYDFYDDNGNITDITTDKNGNVYVAGSLVSSGDYFVRKYDPSLSQVWSYDTNESEPVDAITVDPNENVYIGFGGSGGARGDVRKLDSNGNEVWTVSIESAVTGLASDSNHVYAARLAEVYKLDQSDGSTVWSYDPVDPAEAIGVDTNGNVYIGCRNGFVEKVDSNGTSVWTSQPDSTDITDLDVDNDGNVYYIVSNPSGTVSKLDTNNGNLVWEDNLNDPGKSIDVTDNFVYASGDQGSLKKYDAVTGETIVLYNIPLFESGFGKPDFQHVAATETVETDVDITLNLSNYGIYFV